MDGDKRVVVIVDDDKDDRHYLTEVFRINGYVVKPFENPNEALGMIDDKVDVVVTDLVMPQMSGVAFRALVKEKCPGVPVVGVTGQRDTKEDWMSSRFDGALLKPFLPKEILYVIDAVLETGGRTA